MAADEEVGTSAFDDVREKVGHATFVVTRHFTELELFDSSLLLSRFCTHSRNAPACEALIKREQSRSISAMEPGIIFFVLTQISCTSFLSGTRRFFRHRKENRKNA